jgi:hypothetical protein
MTIRSGLAAWSADLKPGRHHLRKLGLQTQREAIVAQLPAGDNDNATIVSVWKIDH